MTTMFTWDIFIWFGTASVLTSAAGALTAMTPEGSRRPSPSRSRLRRKTAIALSLLSLVILTVFITGLWLSLERPPLKTMGETRLWYSFFALAAGLFTYIRWKFKWILSFSTVLATVFIMINLLRPEIHDQTLMPALQSAWFIPHVTVYMFSYSFLGCAFLLALVGLFKPKADVMAATDTLIYIGMAFRSPLGKGGVGPLLELGSEGDLGACDLAQLYDIYSYEAAWKGIREVSLYDCCVLFPMPSDVLVGSKLSANRSRQYTCL